MAKTAEKTKAEPAAGASEGVTAPKRAKTRLLVGGALGLVLCLGIGGYVAMPTALAMMGSTQAGETAGVEPQAEGEGVTAAAHGESAAALPLPAERVVSRAAAATDYQIVSIYDGEAYLATPDDLIRIKVGSSAPGIGDILSITTSETGGIITGSLATLKTT
jgi:hypothetical protein